VVNLAERNLKGQFVKGCSQNNNTGRTRFKKGHEVPESWRTSIVQTHLGNQHWKQRKTFKHSETTKQILRQYALEQFKNGIPAEQRKKMLARRTPSSLEAKMISIIEELNLPYKFVGDGKFFIENKNPDFINCNGRKIAIEVFYRKHKEQLRNGLEAWKQERQGLFAKYGWKIIFLDETQVNEEEVRRRLK